jgi:hypothetical protein
MEARKLFSEMRGIKRTKYHMIEKACVELAGKIYYLNALEIRSLQDMVIRDSDLRNEIIIYNGRYKGNYQKPTKTIIINEDGTLDKNIDSLFGNDIILVKAK